MTSCWTRAYLLSARCPIDGVEEEQQIRASYAQAVAQAQRKRLFEYFDYTAEIAATVGLLPGLTITPMYTYTHKFQDHFRGDLGFNYGLLKAETDEDTHNLDLRLAYNTALLFAQKRFPVPLSLSLRYIDRLAGTNNRLHIRSLGFILAGSF
jgi:hypothetical protein